MAKKQDATAEVKEPQEGKKKSPLMKIIVLVLLLAVVGGGGFFAYTKFFAGKQEESPAQAKSVPEKAVMKNLETFLVNLSDPGGERYLKVTIELKLSNEAALAEFDARTPELRDAILMLLSSKEYDDISSLSGKLALKRSLIASLNRLLTTGRVLEIYFTEFLVQ